ncbi:MAG: helix-turn-helix domain-containing protein, partial [Nitrosomonadales bacterium]|nr:helix-turn-helix domain-containing protein [Nitrosomonadales bacterium]
PLGSNKAKHIDFALVCATNQKLRDKVEKGEFRSDLYYRINGLSVALPALSKRSDLEALVKIILQTENAVDTLITDEVMALFKQHPWPGNVRQLHNVVRTALALSMRGTIELKHLPQDFVDELQDEELMQTSSSSTCLESLTMEAILTALHRNQGNVSAAARDLGLSRNTLYRKLKPLS